MTGSRDSAGVGLPLLIVLSLLGILAFLGFRQLFFASHVNIEASRGAWGEIALNVADSAVEELMHRVQSDAGDPSRRLFHELRKDVLAGQSGELPIPDSSRLDVAPRLLEQSGIPGLNIEAASAEVVYQRQFEDVPWERFGLLRYRARVTMDASPGARVVRDLEVAQGFKVVMATVPRPFDQATVYVGDVWSLTDLADVNRRRERYLARVATHAGWLDRAMALSPAGLKARYSEARSAIPSSSDLSARIPPLAETKPAMLIGIGHQGQEFPIDGLDLARKLASEELRVAGLEGRAAAALAALEGSPGSESVHEAFLTAVESSLEGLQGLMSRIWAYGAGYSIVGAGDKQYQELARRHNYLEIDHWRRVAGFVLRDEAGLTVQSRFDALRRRLGVMNGVVLAETPSAPLAVSGNVAGKLVLVVAGGTVVLDGTNSGDRPSDLLTVVAVGGTVEVRGEVHATVVLASLPAEQSAGPPDSKALFAPGATLRGGLVIERLGQGSTLAGSLFREDKYHSGAPVRSGAGALRDRYAVLVSPLTAYRRVANK